MAEWPKLHTVEHRGNPDDGEYFRQVEVIRADLGRELYEALKEVCDGLDFEYAGTSKAPTREERKVLARYEREVGS